ncbi:MAG TPA: hypothetical protein VN369_07515 [Terriglobales bacterium]|nr:hypothetical protein [Terriglobales bacterium]
MAVKKIVFRQPDFLDPPIGRENAVLLFSEVPRILLSNAELMGELAAPFFGASPPGVGSAFVISGRTNTAPSAVKILIF